MMEVAYVRHKSERMEQIEKIANDPFSILDMKCPSEEACLLAYVEEQTLPVCRAAVMQNPDAMRLVDEWFKEDL